MRIGSCDICGRPRVPIAIDRMDGLYGLAICRTCVHASATVDRILEIATPARPPFIDLDTRKLIRRV